MKIHLSVSKKLVCTALCCALLLSALITGSSAAEKCPEITGSNIDAHEYTYYWSSVINSYLAETANGYMRVQNGAVEGKYLIEYFNRSYELSDTVTVNEELPVFGGFYAMGNNYYILSGQNNPKESASVECFRITKYDINWKRISAVGLRDCNTYIPFDAGDARFAEYGKYLFIRTSHEMYADSNGTHHQANVMIEVDTESMKITDSYTDVMNPQVGYVSHSFNQFIHIDGDKLVTLDHGDAIPRSVVLIKYPTDISTGAFFSWDCEVIDAIEIPGEFGDNRTGLEIGAFEISDSSYLIAYSAVKLDDDFRKYDTQNIYIAAVDKKTNRTTTHSFTNFSEGQEGARVPHMVKLDNDRFLLLWAQGDDVFYTLANGRGESAGGFYCISNASLSDCTPIIADGKVMWYIYEDEVTTFYDISINDLSDTSKTVIYSGHKDNVVSYPEKAGGNCTVACEKCGRTDTFATRDKMMNFWNFEGGAGTYNYPLQKSEFKTGDKLYIITEDYEGEYKNDDKIIKISDSSAITYTETDDHEGFFTFRRAGTYTVSIYYKYSPLVAETYTVTVTGEALDAGSDIGDVNISGDIDMMDYILLKRAYFGTFSFDAEQQMRGDVNLSGDIDMMDYILLKRAYFGTFILA